MERIIIDTSAWIQFSIDPEDKISRYIQYSLNNERVEIYTCLTILQEFLQGFRNDNDFDEALKLLTELNVLPSYLEAIIEAAKLYRLLRKKGITIRKPNDCLIAWYTIHHDLTLVHNDSDFDLIAQHTPLKTYQPS